MEQEFLTWLRSRLAERSAEPRPLSDDAALLSSLADQSLVVTTDLIAEGTHFELAGEVTPQRVGRKALAVNLSDLAAMAAEPVAVFVSILMPHDNSLTLAKAIYEGMFPLADEFNVKIAGGDTNRWRGGLAISVTAIGRTTQHGPLTRCGGAVGDVLVVTGELGGSRLGKHLDFTPRVRESLLLNAGYQLHAGMDISDGLVLDASRLCEESQCGAIIRTADVPLSADAAVWATQAGEERSPLDHGLADGEDFELLLAMPANEAQRLLAAPPISLRLSVVGELTAKRGLRLLDADGQPVARTITGYLH